MKISIKQYKKIIQIPVKHITMQKMCEKQLEQINKRIYSINKELRSI